MPSRCCGQPMMECRPSCSTTAQRRAAAEQAGDDAGQHAEQGRRIEDQRVTAASAAAAIRCRAHTARRRSRYLLYSPNRVRKLGSVRTASGTILIFAAEHLVELVARAAHVPVAGDQPDRVDSGACASQRAASSALERVSTDSLPRSTQHSSSFALPPNAPREIGLGHRRIGAGDQQPLAPCRRASTSIACSIRPLPPVSTTAASVGCARRRGAGLPSVNANSTKPSA